MLKRYALASLLVAVFATSASAQDTSRPLVARDARGDLTLRDERGGFGNPRVWAFSTDAGLSIERATISGQPGATTTLIIQPAFDVFVIRNLSVGGQIGLRYTRTGDVNSTRFTVGPRVGYNVEISELLSFWPKIGFSFSHFNSDNARDSANSLALNLFAPIMLHPAPHFFAGFGPFLDTDLSGDSRATAWGFKLTLGGWIQQRRRA